MEKLQGDIGEVLRKSIKTEPATGDAATGGALRAISDCVNFDFDIKIFSVKGKFCKSGVIDYTVTIAGIQIQHLQVDLSRGEYCNTVSVGVEEVQYCFYMKGSCLHTRGYIDGWLHDKQSWNEKIVCV